LVSARVPSVRRARSQAASKQRPHAMSSAESAALRTGDSYTQPP
jgi:hypothetical protein